MNMFVNSAGVPSFSNPDFAGRSGGSVATHAAPELGDMVYMVVGLCGLIIPTTCLGWFLFPSVF